VIAASKFQIVQDCEHRSLLFPSWDICHLVTTLNVAKVTCSFKQIKLSPLLFLIGQMSRIQVESLIKQRKLCHMYPLTDFRDDRIWLVEALCQPPCRSNWHKCRLHGATSNRRIIVVWVVKLKRFWLAMGFRC
jgi:hypothetical protein